MKMAPKPMAAGKDRIHATLNKDVVFTVNTLVALRGLKQGEVVEEALTAWLALPENQRLIKHHNLGKRLPSAA